MNLPTVSNPKKHRANRLIHAGLAVLTFGGPAHADNQTARCRKRRLIIIMRRLHRGLQLAGSDAVGIRGLALAAPVFDSMHPQPGAYQENKHCSTADKPPPSDGAHGPQ